MKTHDFWYELPPELIAQSPSERRDHSRLMLLDRQTGQVGHGRFLDLPLYLRPGDLLVLNNTKVLSARLIGERESGGAAEVLLLRDKGDGLWECLVKPGKSIGIGSNLRFGGGELSGTVESKGEKGLRDIRFSCEGIFLETLEHFGRVPLPPYIKEDLGDPGRYQTVYAKHLGAAAAPTAGLHFTPELLKEVGGAGIDIRELTLHIGLGTFRPVQSENVEEHVMHSEYFIIPDETAQAITRTRKDGGRVIAVGTTVARALEASAASDGSVEPVSGDTDIFIKPGYKFKTVDGLVTNFHLPESTLVMLVSALAGRENVLNAYSQAVLERYRFFSFGDAMLII